MARMPAKNALIEQLIADGATHVFGNPGTTEQGFMDVLQDYPQLKFMLALHEGVAVGMADAYARITRRPAFVELHTAPGLGNGIGMIYNAQRGGTPLVIYAGHVDTRGLSAEPILSGDLVAMARTVCKWSAEVIYPEDVPTMLRRALKVALEPPQGPVFLSLPLDVLDGEVDTTIRPTVHTSWRSRPDLAAVRSAAAMLAAAHRPVLIVGDGVGISGAQEEVSALAGLVGAPLIGTFTSEVNVAFDHPLWVGGVPLMSAGAIRAQLEGHDLIVMIGTPEPAGAFPTPGGPLPPDARVIEINPNTWELGKNHAVDIAIAADPKATLAELLDLVRAEQPADQAAAACGRARGDHGAQQGHP
ncbi:MAG: thiamine pyrophosphate-binding protein [Dehalococcoidia bacterium]